MLTAREIMHTALINVERGTSIRETASRMAQEKVGSVIVTAGSYPVGIVTETDMTQVIASGGNPDAILIETIMSSPLFSTNPDTDIIEVANAMAISNIKKMPVLEKQQVIGIITQTDLIKNMFVLVKQLHEAYREGKISVAEYTERGSAIYNAANTHLTEQKLWHMRCLSCGHQFLVEERNGTFSRDNCPMCYGRVTYDPSPPI